MAFLEDTDIDERSLQHPIWGAFSQVKDNLEGLIVLNLLWSLQLLPALAAFILLVLPFWLRILLFLYSGMAIAVTTGVLFAIIARVCQDEAPRPEMVRSALREYALPGVLRLSSLYGCVVGLGLIILLIPTDLTLLNVLLRLVLLCLLFCSFYWGPIFAAHPTHSPLAILRHSFTLTWRYPGQTLLSYLVMLVVALIGIISVGGLFLIAPVMVVLLQTRRYQELTLREQQRAERKTQPRPIGEQRAARLL